MKSSLCMKMTLKNANIRGYPIGLVEGVIAGTSYVNVPCSLFSQTMGPLGEEASHSNF